MTKRKWLDISIISAVTFALLIPSLSSGFVNLDDNFYVTDNVYIRHLTLGNIAHFFTSFHHGVYAPIQYLTYMLVYSISNYHPALYHLTGVVFYILSGIMVYLIVYKIQDSNSIAFFSSLLFLVSPVNIDSAVWVAELKNPQSLFFFSASFYLYMLFREKHLKKLYACSMAAFFLGLLVKPPGSTLLIMMFMYDLINRRAVKDSIKKLLPYGLLTVPFMIVYMIGQSTIGAYHGLISGSIWSQIKTVTTVAAGIFEYPSKLIIPVNLSISYPIDAIIPNTVFVASIAVVLLIIAGIRQLLKKRDKRPAFWLIWYFVNMLPYYGIIAMPFLANWYLYISSIGIYTLIIISITVLTDKLNTKRLVLPGENPVPYFPAWFAYASLVIIIFIYGFFGYKRQSVWKSDVSMWESSLKAVGGDTYVLRNLSIAYFKHDRPYKGIEYGMQLLDKTPDFVMMKYLIGKGYAQLGDYAKARDVLKDAIAQLEVLEKNGTANAAVIQGLGDTPSTLKSMIYTEISDISLSDNNVDEAASLLKKATDISPYASAYEKLAYLYVQTGRIDDAKEALERLVVLQPSDPEAWRMLGYVMARYYNNPSLAMEYFKRSLEIEPDQRYAKEMRNFIETWKIKKY